MRLSLLAGGLVLLASTAVAAPPPARLSMQIAADESVVTAVRERLAPRLRAHGVELAVRVTAVVDVERVMNSRYDREESGDATRLATAWLDGRAVDAAVLFLVPRRGDRVLARRIPLAGGFDEVALAELTYIIEQWAAALLAAQPIGVPRDEAGAGVAALLPRAAAPPAPAPAPAAPAPAPASADLRFAASAGISSWSNGATAVPNVALSVNLERSAPPRAGLWLMGELRRSFDASTPDAGLRIGGGAGYMMVVVATGPRRRGRGRVALGPGLVVTSASPSVPGGTTVAVEAHPRTDVDLAFRLVARWDFPIPGQLAVVAAVGVDVEPVVGQYNAVANGKSSVVFAPWPVRPLFLLGLAAGGRAR